MHFAKYLFANLIRRAKRQKMTFYFALATFFVSLTGIGQLEKTIEFEVVSLYNINSSFSEFCPVFWNEKMIFCSDKEFDYNDIGEANWKHIKRINLFVVSQLHRANDSIVFGLSEIYDPFFLSDDHVGPICFSADGNTCIFTEVSHKGQKLFGKNVFKPQLFSAELKDGKWQNKMPLSFDDMAYSFAHPALSRDGQTLYFCSDIEGGKGGKDLYYATRKDDGWSAPLPVQGVNTQNDEEFPALVGNTLYFARNGADGFGGLDVYRCKFENGNWSVPENLGPTFNSPADDFGICFNPSGENGYFASNRDGGKGGDDLYYFNRIEKIAFNSESDLAGKFEFRHLKGQDVSGLEVILVDDEGNIIMKTTTNDLGEFIFKNLPADKSYSIRLMQDGEEVVLTLYGEDSDAFLVQDEKGAFVYRKLASHNVGTLALIDDEDINLETRTADLTGQFVYRRLKSQNAGGMEVVLVDDEGNIIMRTTTDKYGNFTFSQLPTDKNYIVKMVGESGDIDLVVYNRKNEIVAIMAADQNGEFVYRKLASDIMSSMELLNADEVELEFADKYMAISGEFTYRSLKGSHPGVIPFEIYDGEGNLIFRGFTDESGYFHYSHLPALKELLFKLDEDSPFYNDSIGLVILSRSHDVVIVLDKNENGFFVYRKLSGSQSHMDGMVDDDDIELALAKDKTKPVGNAPDKVYGLVNASEIQVIYFDRISFKLSWKDLELLDKVVNTLNENPSLMVKVEAFSSSPGENEYNLRISEKRMNGVRDYLVSKGVSRRRIQGSFLGEAKLVNDCDDSKDCKKEQHALNRRVEITFLKR